MGIVGALLRWAGVMPARDRDAVLQEAADNERRRKEVTDRLSYQARLYLREYGNGLSVEELSDILMHEHREPERGEDGDADQ